MGKSSSNDELTIRNQFDRICKLALKGEAAVLFHGYERCRHCQNDESCAKHSL